MLQKYKRPVKFPCFVSHVQSATPPGYGFLGVLAWSIAPFDFVPKEKGLLQREGQCNSPEIELHEKRKIIPTAAVLCDGSDVQLTAADVPVDYNGSAF